MTTAPDSADLIRSLARGDFDTHRQLSAALDQPAGWAAYAEYLAAAFVRAVQRRFRPGGDPADLIWFIASVREQFDGTGRDIDPVAAHTLIGAVLGEADVTGLDGEVVGKLETVLLFKLLTDEDLTDPQLDDFLAEVDRDVVTQSGR